MSEPRSLTLASPDETAALARRIAPRLRAGDTLLLEGPIGAGKSHFARAVIKTRLAALGRDEDVPSPTYTLVQSYDLGDLEIWHTDLYRLGDLSEVAELGLEEAFETAICLVEWPDRLGKQAPSGALRLAFAQGTGDDARLLEVTGDSKRWTELLEAEEPVRVG